MKAVQKTVSDNKAAREGVEKKLIQLKCSVLASDLLAAKLAESEKSLKTDRVEVTWSKEHVAHADTEKTDSDKLFAQVHEESEPRKVHLNVAIVGRNWAEKLTHLLVTEYVDDVNAVA